MKRDKTNLLRWMPNRWVPLLFTFFLFCSTSLYAQVDVKGKILDEKGESLIGVSVKVKGTTFGTTTNGNGEFSLRTPKSNSILEISYLGYQTQEVNVQGKNFIQITLQEETKSLDEVVVVAYGSQKKTSVTGAISTVSQRELLKAPTMSISNLVGARVAGVSMLQQSGQPGSDAASLLVRGQGAIYVVDGVVRDFNEIDPNEIESVSILKDATSAALYGLNASAVVLVTTKRGRADKLEISYTGSYGISQNANQLQWLDGPGYAYWYNKARELDGDATVFTNDQVQKMIDGKDGWGNTDWYKKVFGMGTNQHHNVSATGGNEKVRFFGSIGAFDQKGNVANYNYNRYNFRSNVDSKISKNFSLELGVSGRLEKRDNPRYSANPNDWHNIPQQAVRALPYVAEKMTIDGKEYYTSTNTASSPVAPLAAINESGYARSNNTYIQTNFALKYDAPWLEGLSFKFMGAYDIFQQFSKTFSVPFKTALAALPNSTTEKISYSIFKDNSGITSLTESAYSSTNAVTQSSANFDRTFDKHKINTLLLVETRNNFSNRLGVTGYGLDFLQLDELDKITNKTANGDPKYPVPSGGSSQARVIGLVGRVNYEYNDKYLAEFSIRRDGTYLFWGNTNSQWINLPGISLGWRVNKEDWFKADWVNNFKIRGGVGKTATSSVTPFQYLNLMAVSPNSVIIGNSSQSLVYTKTLGNPNLSWESSINYNLGTDFSAWRGLLGIEFDVFYKYQYDIPAYIAGAYPPSMGGYFFNVVNKNKIDYRGFDFTITHDNKIGDFQYGVKWISSFAKRRWLYYAGDSPNTPDYMKLTGKEVGSQLGFIAEGLFLSQEEIDNSPTIPGAKVLPGYIKYQDRNGDGKITYAQDMGYVGKSAYPKYQTSLNLNGAWKGFDFDILLQGGLGRTVALTGVYTSTGSEGIMDNTAFTKLFYHGGNSPQFLAENSWTPENTNAEFPRLSLVTVSSNNAYSSTFWYRSGDYLRFKTFQVGYSLPERLIKSWGVKQVRFYVEGSNIFTLSELMKYNIDPEQPGVNNGYYPQQKTFSGGIKITL